jgi:uncharacterized UBP type Zn finger protein
VTACKHGNEQFGSDGNFFTSNHFRGSQKMNLFLVLDSLLNGLLA